MKFSKKCLIALGLFGCALAFTIDHAEPNRLAGHGLRVVIDPDNGEFQRQPAPTNAWLSPTELSQAIGSLFSKDTNPPPVEVPALANGGGYLLNLENHYRPSRQRRNNQPGS